MRHLLVLTLAVTPTLAPAQSLLHEIVGTAPADTVGHSLASVGDVDGDHHDDLVVGCRSAHAAGVYRGRVLVVSGATGQPLFVIEGDEDRAYLGTAVCGLGDVTGDGVPDFAVSAPYHDGPAGADCGLVRVHSGADASVVYERSGSTANGALGTWLADAGDQNGDGRSELAVSSRQSDAGRITVVDVVTGVVRFTVDGLGTGDQLGHATAGAGDLDGDGVADLLVGAYQMVPTGGPGYVQVRSGADGSLVDTVTGDAAHDAFGVKLCAAHDIDGDGVRDFLVGARHTAPVTPFAPGYVRAFSGATRTPLWTRSGSPGSFDRLSRPAAVGDVDGDGRNDFVLGAPEAVDAFTSAGPGFAQVVSESGHVIGTLTGPTFGSRFGGVVAPAGDLDNDGLADFAIAAQRYDPGSSPFAGMVRLYSGACTSLALIIHRHDGPGSVSVRVACGPPGSEFFTAFTLDPANGGPGLGTGWLYGLHVPETEVIDQFRSGAPPFRGVLDAGGESTFSVPEGSFDPAVYGTAWYGVSMTFDATYQVTAASAPKAYVVH